MNEQNRIESETRKNKKPSSRWLRTSWYSAVLTGSACVAIAYATGSVARSCEMFAYGSGLP